MIKTPPYLTARPEVTTTKLQTGGPDSDFLILASDGLWNLISSEDAVLCVQSWIEAERKGLLKRNNERTIVEYVRAEVKKGRKLDQGLYHKEGEGLRWAVKPEYFVENCATHLIRNALGGNRRSLFYGILNVGPSRSREVRDDISVQVVFFGDAY